MDPEENAVLFSSADEEDNLMIDSEDEADDDDDDDDDEEMDNDDDDIDDDGDEMLSEENVDPPNDKEPDTTALRSNIVSDKSLWPLGKDVFANLKSFQVPQKLEAHVNALQDSLMENHLQNFHADVSKFEQNDLGLAGVENRNTQRKTDTDIRILISYLRAVNESRPPESVPPQQLDKYLSNFFTIVKKHDGNEYEPASLRGMLCSVERYLKMKNYQSSVTRDIIFINTRMALKNKQQRLRELGKGGKKPNEPFGKLTIDKVNHLFVAREMGPYTPMSIINTLCFLFIVHFRLRKAIDHKNLTWGDIQLRMDSSGKEYLVYEPKNNSDGPKVPFEKGKHSKLYIWARPETPERNPVGIYKNYREKRPVSMLFDSSPFYLGITTLHPSPVQAWYRTCAMGVNKLSDLVRMIRDITGLPRATLNPPVETLLSNTYSSSSTTSTTSLKNSLSMPLVYQYAHNLPLVPSTTVNSYTLKNEPLPDTKNKIEEIESTPMIPTSHLSPIGSTCNVQKSDEYKNSCPGSIDDKEGLPRPQMNSLIQRMELAESSAQKSSVALEAAKSEFKKLVMNLNTPVQDEFMVWLKCFISDQKEIAGDELDSNLDGSTEKGKTSITLHITLTPEALAGKGPVTLRANTSVSKCSVVKPNVASSLTDHDQPSENVDQTNENRNLYEESKTSNGMSNESQTVKEFSNVESNDYDTQHIINDKTICGKKRHFDHSGPDVENAKHPKNDVNPVNLSHDRYTGDSHHVGIPNTYGHGPSTSENIQVSSGILLNNEDRNPRVGTVIPQAHASRLYPSAVRDLNMLLPMTMGYNPAIQRIPEHLFPNTVMLNSLTSSLLQSGQYNPFSQMPSSGTDAQNSLQVEPTVPTDNTDFDSNYNK